VRGDLGAVQKFLGMLESGGVLGEDRGHWEYCYGRAGTLYLLHLTRKYPGVAALVDPVVQKCGEDAGKWPAVDYGKGKEYYGAGHGDIGIITQVVLSDSSFAPRLEGKLRSFA